MDKETKAKRRTVIYSDSKMDIVIVPFNYMVKIKTGKSTGYRYYPTIAELFNGLLRLTAETKLPKGAFKDITEFRIAMNGILDEVKQMAWTIKDHPMVLTGE